MHRRRHATRRRLRIGHEPADVWYVGNSLIHDIAAARAAGMPAIWYNATAQPSTEPVPDATVSSWTEFNELIAHI